MTHPPLLVLAAGSLGDALLTLPAIQALSTVRLVTVAGTAPYQNLGAELLGVNDVISLEDILPPRPLSPEFLEAVLFLKKHLETVPGRAWGSQITITRPEVSFEDFLQSSRPAHQFWNETASLFHPDLAFPEHPSLRFGGAFRQKGLDLLQSWDMEHALVIHPGSGGRAKNVPLAFFHQAVQKAKSFGMKSLVVWGEAEEHRLDEIREALPEGRDLGLLDEPLSLGDLSSVLAAARGYLGCDSGVTHLAAACGAPVFAVFGPTDPRVWAPPGAVTVSAGPSFGVLAEVDFMPVWEGFLRSLP